MSTECNGTPIDFQVTGCLGERMPRSRQICSVRDSPIATFLDAFLSPDQGVAAPEAGPVTYA